MSDQSNRNAENWGANKSRSEQSLPHAFALLEQLTDDLCRRATIEDDQQHGVDAELLLSQRQAAIRFRSDKYLCYSNEITIRSRVAKHATTEWDKWMANDHPQLLLYGFDDHDGNIVAYSLLDLDTLVPLLRKRLTHISKRRNKDGTEFFVVDLAGYPESVSIPITHIRGK